MIWIEPVPGGLYLATLSIILTHDVLSETHFMTLRQTQAYYMITCEFSLETEPLKVGGARC